MINRSIITLAIILGVNQGLFAQNPANTKAPNILAVKIIQIASDSSGKTTDSIPVTLAYDFKGQYPYYKVNKHDWKSSDMIQLKFTKIPKKGHIYAFSIDAKESFRIYKPIHLKDIPDSSTSILLPSADTAIRMDSLFRGKSRICFWYALNNPIDQSERSIQGMELTTGSIIQRNNRQIGSRLYLPCEDWHLAPDFIGVDLTTPDAPKADNMVIPVVLEFTNSTTEDKSEKMGGAKGKKHKKHGEE